MGYISEAAASLVDRMCYCLVFVNELIQYDYLIFTKGHIDLHVVPRTEIVSLASPSFYYSYMDRHKNPLPQKTGSLQLFMFGFMDATKFLREGPRMLEDGRLLRDPRSGDLHPTLKLQFQDEFEKMIILDYIIRNTDRGLDNWMVYS
jgi:hypothetical protein